MKQIQWKKNDGIRNINESPSLADTNEREEITETTTVIKVLPT